MMKPTDFFGIVLVAMISFVCLFPAPALATGDCSEAETIFHKAMKTPEGEGRLALLNLSLGRCPSFEGFYAAGRTLALLGRLTRAEAAYRSAEALAIKKIDFSRVYVNLATVYEEMGRTEAAYACFRRSTEFHRFPKVEKRIMEMDEARKQQGVPSEAIVDRLSRVAKSFAVEPAIDLYVHFDFDSAVLNPAGISQVRELGKAVENPVFSGHNFIIIGHTDCRGGIDYNMQLSLERARAVKAWLAANTDLAGNRITVKGLGKSKLLYQGDTPEIHALNRRVEVVLVAP